MPYSAVHAAWFTLLLILGSAACGLLAEDPLPDTSCFPACAVDETCTLSEDRMTARCSDTFTGGGPLEGIESCQWLAECVDECERQQLGSKCAAECELQAAEDVLKVHSTWRACVHSNCNAIRSSECLREWCAPQTTRCFGELPGDALMIGQLICLDVAQCTQNCLHDPDCAQDCLHHGTTDAQNQWTALTSCAHPNCPDPNTDYDAYLECAENQCPDHYKTCFGPGPNPAEGTDNCAEVYRCSLSCPDSICQQNCVANGTLKARKSHQSLLGCTLNHCSPLNKKELDPAMCSAMMCGTAMERCFNEHAIE